MTRASDATNITRFSGECSRRERARRWIYYFTEVKATSTLSNPQDPTEEKDVMESGTKVFAIWFVMLPHHQPFHFIRNACKWCAASK